MLFRLFLAACAASVTASAPASAQVPDTIATAEILEGWRAEDGRHMTALRITLAPGWKTYWRAPGDAGIPPRFDWSGSENAARIAISYTLPNVFELAGMRSIGYHDEAIFPLAVEPKTEGEAITLSSALIIGVCEEVCVPLELDVTAILPASVTTPDADVIAAMENRPVSAQQAGVGDVSCTADRIEDGLRVVANIDMPSLGADEMIVMEYSDPTIWISEPKLIRDGNRLEAHVDLVPMAESPFAYFREETRITVFGGGQAVEINGC